MYVRATVRNQAKIVNCTFLEDESQENEEYATAIAVYNPNPAQEGSLSLRNSIIWGAWWEGKPFITGEGGPVMLDIANCDIATGLKGVWAASVSWPAPMGTDWGEDYPLFNFNDGGWAYYYRLMPESPVINKGADKWVISGETDMEGHPRIVGAAVDMGAYEVQDPLHTR